MAKFITYNGGKIFVIGRTALGTAQTSLYIPWTNTSGANRTVLYSGVTGYPFDFNSIYATSDTIDTASESDYAENKLTSITISYPTALAYTVSDGKLIAYRNVMLKNSTSSSVTVGGLKQNVSIRQSSGGGIEYALGWGYYFDEPLTIEAGSSVIVPLSVGI